MRKSSNDFLEIDITQAMLARAKFEAAKIPAGIRNSIRSGQGRLDGVVGEEAVLTLPGMIRPDKTSFEFDLLYTDAAFDRAYTVEVKTKRRPSGEPAPHYNASIANSNARQTADFIAFVSIRYDDLEADVVGKAWIAGLISTADFHAQAFFGAEGQPDPNGGGWPFRADCWNLPYSGLSNFSGWA